ncbi:unnamed protein product, partial [Rotaria sp. Silwood1]
FLEDEVTGNIHKVLAVY